MVNLRGGARFPIGNHDYQWGEACPPLKLTCSKCSQHLRWNLLQNEDFWLGRFYPPKKLTFLQIEEFWLILKKLLWRCLKKVFQQTLKNQHFKFIFFQNDPKLFSSRRAFLEVFINSKLGILAKKARRLKLVEDKIWRVGIVKFEDWIWTKKSFLSW